MVLAIAEALHELSPIEGSEVASFGMATKNTLFKVTGNSTNNLSQIISPSFLLIFEAIWL